MATTADDKSAPKVETPSEKQTFAAAIAKRSAEEGGKLELAKDTKRLAKVLKEIRDTFKDTHSSLKLIDVDKHDGGKTVWAPTWDKYRLLFEDALAQSKKNANEIAAYAIQFDETVLKYVKKEDTKPEVKRKLLENHIKAGQGFEQDSREIAEKFGKLVKDLGDFKLKLGAWIKGLNKDAEEQVAALDAEIETLKNKISSLKTQMATATAVGGAFSTAAALGLFPAFTVFVLIGAVIAIAAGAYYMNKLNNDLNEAEKDLATKEGEKATLVKKLDELVKLQKEFELKISDNIDKISDGIGLLEAIWKNVTNDCKEIVEWLEKGAEKVDTPATLYASVETGGTMYKALAEALTNYGKLKDD